MGLIRRTGLEPITGFWKSNFGKKPVFINLIGPRPQAPLSEKPKPIPVTHSKPFRSGGGRISRNSVSTPIIESSGLPPTQIPSNLPGRPARPRRYVQSAPIRRVSFKRRTCYAPEWFVMRMRKRRPYMSRQAIDDIYCGGKR